MEVKTHGKGEHAVHGVFCGECCVHHAHEPEDNGEEELWLEVLESRRPVALKASADWLSWGSKLDACTAETMQSVAVAKKA